MLQAAQDPGTSAGPPPACGPHPSSPTLGAPTLSRGVRVWAPTVSRSYVPHFIYYSFVLFLYIFNCFYFLSFLDFLKFSLFLFSLVFLYFSELLSFFLQFFIFSTQFPLKPVSRLPAPRETSQGTWKTRSLGIPCGDRITRRLRSMHPGSLTCSMIKAAGGQILKLLEAEARLQFPHLVVASLGAQRKDKPGGVISARVLFDGSNGIQVNRRIRLRDQERAPVASDLKRCMREKARRGRADFLIDGGRCRSAPAGAGGQARLEFTGVPGRGGRRCIYSYRWDVWHRLRLVLLVTRCRIDWMDYSLYSVDDQPLRGITWWLMISTLKLGEVIIEPH